MRLGSSARGLEVESALFARVVDPKQTGGGTRLLECLGHYQCDRLVIMLDLRACERLGDVEAGLLYRPSIVRSDNCQHARGRLSCSHVDRLDTPFGDSGADDIAISGIGCDGVILVGIHRCAGGLKRPFGTRMRLADDLLLVDWIRARGRVELHADRASAIVDASARVASGSLKALSAAGFAPVKVSAVTAAAP